jgi:DNA-binding response OmpR family regulator
MDWVTITIMQVKNTQTILIVEDEEAVRSAIKRELRTIGQIETREAEDMQTARGILADEWDELALIFMDVMLPGDPADAARLKDLVALRDPAYSRWLKLEDEGRGHNDPEWLKVRFEVDAYDSRMFNILNVEGGIELITECAQKHGNGGKLAKPVIYLSARENEAVRQKGLALLGGENSQWLIKPASPRQLLAFVKQVLTKKP